MIFVVYARLVIPLAVIMLVLLVCCKRVHMSVWRGGTERLRQKPKGRSHINIRSLNWLFLLFSSFRARNPKPSPHCCHSIPSHSITATNTLIPSFSPSLSLFLFLSLSPSLSRHRPLSTRAKRASTDNTNKKRNFRRLSTLPIDFGLCSNLVALVSTTTLPHRSTFLPYLQCQSHAGRLISANHSSSTTSDHWSLRSQTMTDPTLFPSRTSSTFYQRSNVIVCCNSESRMICDAR
ncbi:hypothetical protein EDD21DRAFT_92216 [Dissophora ornata]|nr:hypothetical protein EDD21DRAFT_92216 [Dissophora ornata]